MYPQMARGSVEHQMLETVKTCASDSMQYLCKNGESRWEKWLTFCLVSHAFYRVAMGIIVVYWSVQSLACSSSHVLTFSSLLIN